MDHDPRYRALGVVDDRASGLSGDYTGVSHLTTRLRIKRRPVEHDLHLARSRALENPDHDSGLLADARNR